MRLIIYVLSLAVAIAACSGNRGASEEMATDITDEERAIFNSSEMDTVRIADDATEYEIIILDPGFYPWLNSIARPRGYYTKTFLENRNQVMVMNWNMRVQQPMVYNPDLYVFTIDYDRHIDYGYEVNYMLYNYFLYFQRKYNQRLGPFYPRIN